MTEVLPLIAVTISSLVAIGIALWSRGSSRSYSDVKHLRENKVDVSDCTERHGHLQNFKIRIGQESDKHRRSINRLEKGMIFLVQKQGGDPVSMGLMD